MLFDYRLHPKSLWSTPETPKGNINDNDNGGSDDTEDNCEVAAGFVSGVAALVFSSLTFNIIQHCDSLC